MVFIPVNEWIPDSEEIMFKMYFLSQLVLQLTIFLALAFEPCVFVLPYMLADLALIVWFVA